MFGLDFNYYDDDHDYDDGYLVIMIMMICITHNIYKGMSCRIRSGISLMMLMMMMMM
jgi:hypothetical protein